MFLSKLKVLLVFSEDYWWALHLLPSCLYGNNAYNNILLQLLLL